MSKLSKIALATVLTMGLVAPACTVDGEDDGTGGGSVSGSGSGTGSGTGSGSGSVTYTSETFTPVYFDAYLLDYSKTGVDSDDFVGTCLDLNIFSVRFSNGEPASTPFDNLYASICSENQLSAGSIVLENDANAENYILVGKDFDANDEPKYVVVSDGGTVQLTKIANGDLAGTIKNLTARSYTENADGRWTYNNKKAVKFADIDITTKYIKKVDCSDWENLEDGPYCACWPMDCFGDFE